MTSQGSTVSEPLKADSLMTLAFVPVQGDQIICNGLEVHA
jgi:hypothetical protein